MSDTKPATLEHGGPAFPIAVPDNFHSACDGMSLRDYFAGQVLAGLAAHPSFDLPTKADFAAACYEFADAMLAERVKAQEGA